MKLGEDPIERIAAVLPQTQCGECSYAGCQPYAEAIVTRKERLDKCTPGGVETLKKLGALQEQPVAHLLENMARRAKPIQLAVIDEAACIGCTKCIQACPVDAILGAAKQMHTVLSDECSGCELCLAPCPVDCIEMQPLPDIDPQAFYQRKSARFKQRHQQHQARLERQERQTQIRRQQKTVAATAKFGDKTNHQDFIKAALARAQSKSSPHE